MSTAYAWAPITKAEKQDDGTLLVYGPATDAGTDRDKQQLNQEWLDNAMPAWFAEGANVREQHDSKRAVGVGVGLTRDASGAHQLVARVVDPVAVLKVENKVLKGFSVGIKDPQINFGKADAPNGEVVGGSIIEVSLVDRPANPRTLFTMVKADAAGDLVEDTELVEDDGVEEPEVDEADETKADINQAQRDMMADSGVAMPGGQFPIPDEGHLRSAIGHLGNYNGDKAAAKRHIISRARALHLTNLLPADWNVTKADEVLAELATLVPDLAKADDESGDIADAQEAIAAIGRLIASEAGGLAAGVMSEDGDIDCLLDAVRALKVFIAREQAEVQPTSGAPTAANDDQIDGGAVYMPDDVKTEEPDVSKVDTSDGAYLTKADVPDIVKAEISPYGERIAAVEAWGERIAVLEAQLTKMQDLPVGGGPVAMRTASQTQAARAKDTAALRADQYLAKADATNDPTLKQGWRELADQAKAEAGR